MKELIITRSIMIIVISSIGYFLYLEIEQETTRLKACNRYGDLQEFRELCQKQK